VKSADCPKPYFHPTTQSTNKRLHSFINTFHSLVEFYSIAMAPKILLPVAAIATAALAQSSGGCGAQPTLTSGIHNVGNRQYTLKIPENYDSSNPYRLVFGFHWLSGSMGDVVNGNSVPAWYGLEALAEGSAIFVAPDGIDNGWANGGGSDIAFVDSIIEEIEADLCVDQASRFATGFSYGGGMSYAVACARAGEFRAVAPIAGGLISGCDGGKDPIAYLGIHGVSDNVLPISGGIELANTFVGNNGCQPKEVGQPAAGSGGVVRTDFEGCSEPVSFIAWDGPHSGAAPTAPQATWEFFTSLSGGAAAAAPSNGTASGAPAAEAPVDSAPVTEDAQAAPVAEDAQAAPADGQWGAPSGAGWQRWSA
jgi:predicted esterase